MTEIDNVGPPCDVISPERLHPIIYMLIVNKYATLYEIRDVYSIEEVLDLYEACLVNAANRAAVMKGVANANLHKND